MLEDWRRTAAEHLGFEHDWIYEHHQTQLEPATSGGRSVLSFGGSRSMATVYTEQIAEFWPAIMQAWHDHADKCPVIECDIGKRQVRAYASREYIQGLSKRTRAATRRQFKRVTAIGGIMVFIRDSNKRVLQSHVFMPGDER